MNRIVYKNEDNSISVVMPTKEALKFATIDEIAKKDVPHNLPYWIIDQSEIPAEVELMDAWELSNDIGIPHGIGSESSEFSQEILAKYYALIGCEVQV